MGRHPITELTGKSVTVTILDILRSYPIGTELSNSEIFERYSKYGTTASDYIRILLNTIERAGYIKRINKLANSTTIRILKELPETWSTVDRLAKEHTKNTIQTILLDNSKIKGAETGRIYPIQLILTTQVHYISSQVLIYLTQYIKSGYTDEAALNGALDLLLTARAYNATFIRNTAKTKLLNLALDEYIACEKLPPLLKDCVIEMQSSEWSEAIKVIQKICLEATANKD